MQFLEIIELCMILATGLLSHTYWGNKGTCLVIPLKVFFTEFHHSYLCLVSYTTPKQFGQESQNGTKISNIHSIGCLQGVILNPFSLLESSLGMRSPEQNGEVCHFNQQGQQSMFAQQFCTRSTKHPSACKQYMAVWRQTGWL